MAAPQLHEARIYLRAAQQRFDDSVFLLSGRRTTGAIYLAGYAVECILKAMVLAIVPARKQPAMIALFRGSKAHDYDWLKAKYFDCGGVPFPANISKCFAMVNNWSTDLRYKPGVAKPRHAREFLDAVRQILTLAEGRL